jgi:hypothetical protein
VTGHFALATVDNERSPAGMIWGAFLFLLALTLVFFLAARRGVPDTLR